MSKKILYAVLNWGLGHASRSIPIINNLLLDNEVVIASDGEALILLKKEFPKLKFEKLNAYNIVYSKTARDFNRIIFFQLNKLSKAIKNENTQVKKIILEHKITHIISDNRYGVYNKDLPSTIICHQLNLQHKNKFFQKLLNKLHYYKLNKFNEVWIPDFEDNNSFAGEISKFQDFKSFMFSTENFRKKLKYIGLLSRIKRINLEKKYEICIILSGPEPQRTILENILLKQLVSYSKNIVFIRGTELFKNKIVQKDNIDFFNLLDSSEINDLINKSELVICRAGYSSIMDLLKVNKNAILIPTPGQTEQEYLSNYLEQKNWFYTCKQDDFSLKTALIKQKKYAVPKLELFNSFEETLFSFLN